MNPATPEHILSAFNVEIDDDGTARVGMREVVVSAAADPARAAWSAKVRESIKVDDVRLARPIRASDGRYVAGGWHVDTLVEGTPQARHDEAISAANRLHEATVHLERPRIEQSVFHTAERAAYDGDPTALSPRPIVADLLALRRPSKVPAQLVHGDLYGNVLFSGSAAPGLTDITPFWRPAAWAAAVLAVDALAYGGADDGLLARWESLPDWYQMTLRAVLFRMLVHDLHSRPDQAAFEGLARTAALIRREI